MSVGTHNHCNFHVSLGKGNWYRHFSLFMFRIPERAVWGNGSRISLRTYNIQEPFVFANSWVWKILANLSWQSDKLQTINTLWNWTSCQMAYMLFFREPFEVQQITAYLCNLYSAVSSAQGLVERTFDRWERDPGVLSHRGFRGVLGAEPGGSVSPLKPTELTKLQVT